MAIKLRNVSVAVAWRAIAAKLFVGFLWFVWSEVLAWLVLERLMPGTNLFWPVMFWVPVLFFSAFTASSLFQSYRDLSAAIRETSMPRR